MDYPVLFAQGIAGMPAHYGAAGGLGWFSTGVWLQPVPPFPWARGGICSGSPSQAVVWPRAEAVLVPTGISSSCSWGNHKAQASSIPASFPPALSLPQIPFLGTEA